MEGYSNIGYGEVSSFIPPKVEDHFKEIESKGLKELGSNFFAIESQKTKESEYTRENGRYLISSRESNKVSLQPILFVATSLFGLFADQGNVKDLPVYRISPSLLNHKN